MTQSVASLRLVVTRSEPGARREFLVLRRGAYVVLDLIAAAARTDPSLYFRYSCRSGYCGTCTILVDGRPALACQTTLPTSAGVVHVAPLGGFPVVRDLVVDPAPFAARWTAVDGRLAPVARPAEEEDAVQSIPPGPRPLDTESRRPIDESLDCISCGACFAACDLSTSDGAFFGPAALTRAMVLVADRRDADRAGRLAVVAGREGVEGCHGIGACSLVCPRRLDPARAIRRLRRWRVTGLP